MGFWRISRGKAPPKYRLRRRDRTLGPRASGRTWRRSESNAVCPGLVLNERLARSLEVIRQQTERQLLPRGAEPVEVAQAYLYLMRGGYTTGQVLIVNGD